MPSKIRDIADILGVTEAANPTNAVLTSAADGSGSGLVVHDSIGNLPLVGATEGSMAFINSTNRMYIHNGTGWYSATVVNNTPTWTTEPANPLNIVDSATPLVVSAIAQDSEGVPITYSGIAADSAQYLVTISQDSSSFTFTPKSSTDVWSAVAAGNLQDSNGGSFTYTFKASDGVNILSKQSTVNYSGLTAPQLLIGYGANAIYAYTDITFTKSLSLLNGSTNGSGLFDNSSSGQMHGANHATGYVQFEFPVPVKISKYQVFERASSGNSTNDGMRFRTWNLQGSNDNSTWTTLHSATEGVEFNRPSKPGTVTDLYATYTDGTDVTSHGAQFTFTNGTYYTYYRWNLATPTNGYGVVGELALWGR
jgi:hypothetical protein